MDSRGKIPEDFKEFEDLLGVKSSKISNSLQEIQSLDRDISILKEKIKNIESEI